jgi:hypothetical protein
MRESGVKAIVAALAPLALGTAALLVGAAARAAGDQAPGAPATTAVEHADDLAWKATGSLYLQQHETAFDLNLRGQTGALVGWLGMYHAPSAATIGRVGAEYDWRHGSVLIVPTLQAATNGLRAGQLYSELGGTSYAILGVSRTNLRPFYNLSWDPNESVQLGVGHHLSHYDKLYAFTIFDVRLHTGQQDSHVLWRHRLSSRLGITLDGLFKSGHTDSRRYVRGLGFGVYLDGVRWLLKAYYDPFVNFSDDTMFRVGFGAKF